MTPPRHYNPPPCFGLRPRLSRTAAAIHALVAMAGPDGIDAQRVAPMLYMADLHARQYLGRPITEHRWRRSDLTPKAAP